MAYDGQNRLIFKSSVRGTKSYGYDPVSGLLSGVTGTGSYPSKTFTYSNGALIGVTVL